MGLLVIKHPHFPSTVVQSMVIIELWECHMSADCDPLTLGSCPSGRYYESFDSSQLRRDLFEDSSYNLDILFYLISQNFASQCPHYQHIPK
jgi:hypothetical protein